MKYLWAAYKKAGLDGWNDLFTGEQDQFEGLFASLLAQEHFIWVMEADTPRGKIPVGFVVGRPFVYNTMIMGDFTWFPWASRRNVYESAVNIINALRREAHMVFHVEEANKAFATWIARHGIARRVGTMHDILPDPISVWQSRKPNG